MTTINETPSTETPRHRDTQDETTSRTIAAAIEVHRTLGPGVLESVYEECLCLELTLRDINFERQVMVPVVYKGTALTNAYYRLNLVVENEIILEIKSVEQVLRVHKAQLLSYLRLTGKPQGLLINFNVPYLNEGITRVVL